MKFDIEKPSPNMNIGVYLCQQYYLNDKKYNAGMKCGKILRRIFWTREDKSNIIDIFNIWLKEDNKEASSYSFRSFEKAFIKALNKYGQQ